MDSPPRAHDGQHPADDRFDYMADDVPPTTSLRPFPPCADLLIGMGRILSLSRGGHGTALPRATSSSMATRAQTRSGRYSSGGRGVGSGACTEPRRLRLCPRRPWTRIVPETWMCTARRAHIFIHI